MKKPTKMLLAAMAALGISQPALAKKTQSIQSNQIVFDTTTEDFNSDDYRSGILVPIGDDFATGLINLVKEQECYGNFGAQVFSLNDKPHEESPHVVSISRTNKGFGKNRVTTTSISAYNRDTLIAASTLWTGFSKTFEGYDCKDIGALFTIAQSSDVELDVTESGLTYRVIPNGAPTNILDENFVSRDELGSIDFIPSYAWREATKEESLGIYKEFLVSTRGEGVKELFPILYEQEQQEQPITPIIEDKEEDFLANYKEGSDFNITFIDDFATLVGADSSNGKKSTEIDVQQTNNKPDIFPTGDIVTTIGENQIPKTDLPTLNPNGEIVTPVKTDKTAPEGYFVVEYLPNDMETATIWHPWETIALGTPWLNIESEKPGIWNEGMYNTQFEGEDNSLYAEIADKHGLKGKNHIGASNPDLWLKVIDANIEFNGYEKSSEQVTKLVREGFGTGEATLILPIEFKEQYDNAVAAGYFNDEDQDQKTAQLQGTEVKTTVVQDQNNSDNIATLVSGANAVARNERQNISILAARSAKEFIKSQSSGSRFQFGDLVYDSFRAGSTTQDTAQGEKSARIYQNRELINSLNEGQLQTLREYQGLQGLIDFANVVGEADANGDYARIKPTMDTLGNMYNIGGTTMNGRILTEAKKLGFEAQSASMLREELIKYGIDDVQNMAYQSLSRNGPNPVPVFQLNKKF